MRNLNLIIRLIEKNQLIEAEQALKKTLKLNNVLSDGWDLLGVVHKRKGEYKSSEKAFKKAIKIDKNRFTSYNNLGNLYSIQGKYELSIAQYQKAVIIKSDYLDARLNLISDLLNLNLLEKASENLKKIGTSSKTNLRVLECRALIKIKRKEYSVAIEYLKEILKVDPRNVSALQNIASCFKYLGHNDKAIEVLEQAILISPKNASLFHNLAGAYADIGETEKAEEKYRMAVKIDPSNVEHHHWLSSHLWKYGKRNEFDKSYTQFLTIKPNDINIRLALADKYRLAKKYQKAIDCYEYVIKYDKSNKSSLYKLGICQRELGLFDDSFENVRQSWRKNKADKHISEEYVTSLLSIGKADEANLLLGKLLKKDPYNQGLWALKSIALRISKSEEYYWLNNYNELILVEKIDTPSGYSSIKDFNTYLASEIKKMHIDGNEPLEQSLLGGTQTIGDLFSKKKTVISELKAQLLMCERKFFGKIKYDSNHPVRSRVNQKTGYNGSWSVLLHQGGYHRSHFHSKGWYSGPYYVKIPKDIENKEGCLKIGEPGFNMINKLEPDFIITPEEGVMIRFPSMFWHGTLPFKSDEERLTITCDIENFE